MATLLTCIGLDVLDIYDGLPFAPEEDKQDIDKVLGVLENYCVGDTNETYERYVLINVTNSKVSHLIPI